MLKIKRIQCNMFAENCYVVSDESKECMIVDCGAQSSMEEQTIKEYISEEKLKPVLHAVTHGHWDHVIGSQFLDNVYDIKPTICERDAETYKHVFELVADLGVQDDREMPVVGHCLNDGDEIKFGSHSFKMIHTPGHSPGSAVFYCQDEGVCFTGDTLFQSSIGRTDLKGGSMFQIIQSLRTLMQLPDTTRCLPGHGPETTIGNELATNPYLDR